MAQYGFAFADQPSNALRALAAAHRRAGDTESAGVAGKEARALLTAAGSAAGRELPDGG